MYHESSGKAILLFHFQNKDLTSAVFRNRKIFGESAQRTVHHLEGDRSYGWIWTILEKSDQFIRSKGALTENYVCSQLIAMGLPAWYWQSDANAEVDYLIESEGSIVPVEVKSADNTKAKSLRLFCKRYHVPQAVKTSLKNIGWHEMDQTKVWSVPLYMLFDLRRILH